MNIRTRLLKRGGQSNALVLTWCTHTCNHREREKTKQDAAAHVTNRSRCLCSTRTHPPATRALLWCECFTAASLASTSRRNRKSLTNGCGTAGATVFLFEWVHVFSLLKISSFQFNDEPMNHLFFPPSPARVSTYHYQCLVLFVLWQVSKKRGEARPFLSS